MDRGSLPFVVAALLAGVLLPIQAAVNGRLGKTLANPALGALISFAIGTAALVVYVLVARAVASGQPTPAAPASLSRQPWWLWLGGLCGAIYVTTITIAAPRIGVANVGALVIGSQMAAALVLDHFGLFGLPVHPFSLGRALGAALIVGGVVLVQRT
jgi:transporter family-2 protein